MYNLTQVRATLAQTRSDKTRAETSLAAHRRQGSDDELIRRHVQLVADCDETIRQFEAAEAEAEAAEQREQRAAGLRRDLTPAHQRGRDFPVGGAYVGNEPRTYGPESERSFIVDAFSARFLGDHQAGEALARSQREVQVDEPQMRAGSTGGFAGLVVPQYLLNAATLALRAGRPVANTASKIPLPERGMSMIIPKSTTGAAVASQALENTAVQNTDEVWTNITIPVVTIAGQQVVSRQSMERGGPGIDKLILTDLAGAYAAEVDRQVINGTGVSNQMLGILQTAGITSANPFGAAVTAASFMLKVAGAIASIAGAGSGIAATHIAMHPRRWAWLLGQNDSTGRPLVAPVSGGPTNAAAVNTAPGAYGGDGDPIDGLTIVGYLHGLPVVTSTSIPTTLGAGSAEDVVIVYDSHQALLLEDNPMPKFLNFEQPFAASLGIQCVGYGYTGFTAARYPQAFARVGGNDSTAGNGLQAPSF